MEDQLTLRVPAALARRLDARAKATGVKRSQVVREALHAWLDAAPAPVPPSASVVGVRERIGSYFGAVLLGRASGERDALARQLRAHNWRE